MEQAEQEDIYHHIRQMLEQVERYARNKHIPFVACYTDLEGNWLNSFSCLPADCPSELRIAAHELGIEPYPAEDK